MQLGDFELISLSDGDFRLDGGAMFEAVDAGRVFDSEYIVAWALWCGSIGLVASVAYLSLY